MSNYRGGGMHITPMVRNLLIANVLVFVVGALSPTLGQTIEDKGALYFPGATRFYFTQFFTYMFVHGGLGHIFFNMFGLFMFGSMIEMVWGWKRFLNFYLACGLGSGLFHILMMYILMQDRIAISPDLVPGIVGASGAIYGILVAYAYLFPNNKVMLIFLPVPIKAKYFVPLLIAGDLIAGFTGAKTGIAHFGHVGGAIIGVIACFGGRLRRWNK